MSLEGKVAVVTGSAGGIGRACAIRLAQDGADVGLLDLKEAELAETKALVEAADDDMLSRTWRGEVMARIEFAIGKVAPDIEGIDLGGSEFKLSDYEGKVVFLDFWGDW